MSIGTTPSYGSGTPSYSQASQTLQGIYSQQYADLLQQYQGAMSQGMQGLNQAGLMGTTVAPSMRMGYFSQYSQAMNRIAAQQAQQQLGLGQTYAGLGLQQQQQQGSLGLGWAQLGTQQNAQNQQYQLSMQQLQQQSQPVGAATFPGAEGLFS